MKWKSTGQWEGEGRTLETDRHTQDKGASLTEQVLLHGLGAVEADGALLEDVLQELGSLRQAGHTGREKKGREERRLLARWARRGGLVSPASSPGRG